MDLIFFLVTPASEDAVFHRKNSLTNLSMNDVTSNSKATLSTTPIWKRGYTLKS